MKTTVCLIALIVLYMIKIPSAFIIKGVGRCKLNVYNRNQPKYHCYVYPIMALNDNSRDRTADSPGDGLEVEILSDVQEDEIKEEDEEDEVYSLSRSSSDNNVLEVRDEDKQQYRDLDLILAERAKRFYDPKLVGVEKEKCILVAVDITSSRWVNKVADTSSNFVDRDRDLIFSLKESMSELCELVGTAGLQVVGSCIQRLPKPSSNSYIGPGKVVDVVEIMNATNSRTVVIDDDLTPKQQRILESIFKSNGAPDVKILDRTAIILEIFAQHARSREGQLQVELAMLEYRLSRGPSASGVMGKDSGAGFRGPGETKLETDKRVIRDKIVFLKREIETLGMQREQHRQSRLRLGLPLVALVGYTNAGKSTLLNRLSRAGVLAENMLFATLDPTTRRIQMPRSRRHRIDATDAGRTGGGNKGQEVFLTDTVGFISKLPTDLVTAFRATLEEVSKADVLIHVCDRSSPVWEKQRETVLRELDAINVGRSIPIVELWNKIDMLPEEQREAIKLEAACMPIDVEAISINDGAYAIDKGDSYDTNAKHIVKMDSRNSNSMSSSDNSFSAKNDLKDLLGEDKYVWSEEDAHVKGDVDVTFADGQYTRPVKQVRPARRTVFVAASAKDGDGFDDFIEILEDTLNLLLKKIVIFVPYSKDDGLIANIHSQGIVDFTEYKDAGTVLSCRVPPALYDRLKPFRFSLLDKQ